MNFLPCMQSQSGTLSILMAQCIVGMLTVQGPVSGTQLDRMAYVVLPVQDITVLGALWQELAVTEICRSKVNAAG